MKKRNFLQYMNYKTFSISYDYKEIRNTLIEKGYILMTLRRFMTKHLLISDPLKYVFPFFTDISKRPKSHYILNLQLAFRDENQLQEKIIDFSDFLYKWEKGLEEYKRSRKKENWENTKFSPYFYSFCKDNLKSVLGDVYMEGAWCQGIKKVVHEYLLNKHKK